MVRKQKEKKNLLSVQELSRIMDDGIAFSKMNKAAALEKFTECITRSCQELVTALSISTFATSDSDRAQLLREADLLIEISKDCLDQSRFLLQMAYDKSIQESAQSAKLAESLSAEFLCESAAESAAQYGLPRLILARGLALTQDNIVALKGLTTEQIEIINNHVRVHNEKMQSLAKKFRQEVCISVDSGASVEDIKAHFFELRSEALLTLQRQQREIINRETRRFFRAQRRSVQAVPARLTEKQGSLVPVRSLEDEEAEEREEERLDRERCRKEKEEKEEMRRMARRVEKQMERAEFANRINSLKFELMQSNEITTQALTTRLSEEIKLIAYNIEYLFKKINEEGGEEVIVEEEEDGGSGGGGGGGSNRESNEEKGGEEVAMKVMTKRVPINIDRRYIEMACSDVIVSQLYPLVMTVFVRENNDMDTLACIKIDVLKDEMTPKRAGIREIFWLTGGDEKGVAGMYREAIECIKALPLMDNVTKKFGCLRETFGSIMKSVADYHRGKSTEKKAVLSSDDFISILSFVLVKSRLADCRAEVDFMSKLIPDVLCIGEEGFMLTTFMSCVELLVRISSSDLDDF